MNFVKIYSIFFIFSALINARGESIFDIQVVTTDQFTEATKDVSDPHKIIEIDPSSFETMNATLRKDHNPYKTEHLKYFYIRAEELLTDQNRQNIEKAIDLQISPKVQEEAYVPLYTHSYYPQAHYYLI